MQVPEKKFGIWKNGTEHGLGKEPVTPKGPWKSRPRTKGPSLFIFQTRFLLCFKTEEGVKV